MVLEMEQGSIVGWKDYFNIILHYHSISFSTCSDQWFHLETEVTRNLDNISKSFITLQKCWDWGMSEAAILFVGNSQY